MRPIRVLHFARVINQHDFIDTIVRNASPSEFRMMACTLWARGHITDPAYEEAGVPHFVLRGARRFEYPWTALCLARLLRREGIDVLHTHHYDEAFVGLLATRLVRQTRLVVGRHYSDSLYRLSNLKRHLLLSVERLCYERADRVVVPSSLVRDIVLRHGLPAERVALVPYGFEPARYAALRDDEVQAVRGELGLHNRVVVGCFGRIEPQKGQQFLLAAASRLAREFPQLLVLIVGAGPGQARLEAQVRELGLAPFVRFTGWRRDATRLMACVDVVAQPTLQEAFSQVMVEALWMARPLVITPVGGVADVIVDGENGLVVPFSDPDRLAQALRLLLSDRSLAARMGQVARERISSTLAIGRVIPRYEAVYREVVHSLHGPPANQGRDSNLRISA